MFHRLGVSGRVGALLRSRWSVFAFVGLSAGLLLLTGMRVQAASQPSLAPLLTSSRDGSDSLTVWVLFQRLDCVSSRWKIEAWDEAAALDEVRVVGWALDSPDGWPSGADPIDRLDVSFDLRPGPSLQLSRALRALGVASTPAIVVVDGGGRLRRVVPGDVLRSPEDLERILSNLEALRG